MRAAILIGLSIILLPVVVRPAMASEIWIFAIFGLGLNLLLGYTGLLSFGQSTFFGSAAYVAGYLLKHYAINILLALGIGVGVGALSALLVGYLCVQRSGLYFIMLTFALNQLFYFTAYQWTSVTGGEDGMPGIPRPALLQDAYAYYAFVSALFVASLMSPAPFIATVIIGLLTFAGFVAPDSMLNRRVEERQREILRTLSDTLDLLTISVEAGLSLNAAIAQVVQNVPGVLSSEFARMLQEIQLGVPRSDAFRQLAERTDVDELNAFALAMIQADVFGVSIASVLRTQAEQLRIKRRQAAEAKAQQTPVKIVFPLILCILPALFVVIIGPGAIQIINNLLST